MNRDVRVGPKLRQIGPLLERFNQILKSPRYVPFGANLTQLWAKPHITSQTVCLANGHTGPELHAVDCKCKVVS